MKEKWKLKFNELLTHKHLPLIVAGLAILLTLPALRVGLIIDDFFIRVVVRQPESIPISIAHPLDTYSFLKGDPEYMLEAIDFGVLPWWVDPTNKGRFWRPITSLTLFADHRFWPDQIWLMHVQSILWFGALVLAAAFAFRKVMGTTAAAGLAGLMFAIEEAHAVPAAWCANRNSVLACLFGVLAFSFHYSWRKEGKYTKGIAAVIFFAAAILSAEAGFAIMGYIASYAFIMEKGPWKKRLLSLVPYAVVTIIWRAVWIGLDYGVSMPLYKDPIQDPWLFIKRCIFGLPQMITGQFAFPPAEVQAFAAIFKPWTLVFSLGFAVIIFFIFWPLIKTNRTARFFALGAFFALGPFCTTIAQTRNLMFAGIGAFGLLALWFTERPSHPVRPRTQKVVLWFFIILHLILAPILLIVSSAFPMGPLEKFQEYAYAYPDLEGIEKQDLIVVNHPGPFGMLMFLGDRAINGDPLPAHTRVLCQGLTPITLKRTSLTELHLSAKGGITDAFSHMVSSVSEEMKQGKELKLTGMTVKVHKMNSAGTIPLEAVFTFDKNLEDPSYRWFVWSDKAFVPFTLPAVGETVNIPGMKLPFGLKYEDFKGNPKFKPKSSR
jgi:hypothetical protein